MLTVAIGGNPLFGFPVVGESKYQAAIAAATSKSATFSITLVREPDNPQDSNAVRVDGPTGTVGYLHRADAAIWARALDEHPNVTFTCSGRAIGGPENHVEHYGVMLDIMIAGPIDEERRNA